MKSVFEAKSLSLDPFSVNGLFPGQQKALRNIETGINVFGHPHIYSMVVAMCRCRRGVDSIGLNHENRK